MMSKFFKKLSIGCCTLCFAFISISHAVKFEKTIGRISYILDTSNNTAKINKVFSYYPNDSKLVLPAFVKYDGTLFKVVKVSSKAFKALLVDITEINIPHTITKTESNKKAFTDTLSKLDDFSKATINDYFDLPPQKK